ncbi:RsmB/NOP family class I SAM-dependent RNA methyltransferase [Kribbella sp. VKM Ac-2566]|uniref:RsmB/NOP family class I SAM-dependent RNA methyltransferase n=1 Tax=Kribbella sp. VKM Ac-2566 TaxID=2512218 RepID=UPI0010636D15|nr:transcription antitermination factor NusB [Kribbella sp. VKM Ac-2566]TDW92526.1 16S rRNA (cytosine967-C5)-methyltransferase [Kribbella sp. VKM Ac-2566]
MSDRNARNRAPQRRPDPVRRVAYQVVRQVTAEGGYANLALNKALRDARLGGRDAAFCTELVHGTLRWQGTYDAFLARCVSRPLPDLDPELLDVLRLGAHQLLNMRVDSYAAVDEMVTLTRSELGQKRTGLVNAVLRKISQRSLDQWISTTAPRPNEDLLGYLGIAEAHPRWVIEAFDRALAGGSTREHASGERAVSAPGLEDLLVADNEPPRVTLVARPGLADVDELVDAGAVPARWSPYGAVLDGGGDPGRIGAVATGRAGVQDEGSQLVAIALASAKVDGDDANWLDLCAGPGGKSALLAALMEDGQLTAVEPLKHRAELVRQNLRAIPGNHKVLVGDGTKPTWPEGSFDRVLADVPCSGLGALRRRPEARWRRTPEDVEELRPLQEALLDSAITSARPGGVVAYVTCSPHPDETRAVVDAVLGRRDDATLEDARALFPGVPELGDGPDVQLWPHLHGTDAMYLALIRRS